MQYELMRSVATEQCVTVVGDPDQSSKFSSNNNPMSFRKNMLQYMDGAPLKSRICLRCEKVRHASRGSHPNPLAFNRLSKHGTDIFGAELSFNGVYFEG
jgi:hypothetical protein